MKGFRAIFDELCRTEAKTLGRRLIYEEILTLGERAHKEMLSPTKPAPIHRKRNVLLDALVEFCGGEPANTTNSEFRTAAVALSEIQTVCPELTVEELRARIDRYKQKNKDWALTPSSLAKWWSTLGGGARTASARADIYMEPPGWRPVLKHMYDLSEAGIQDKAWLDLDPATRRDVLSRMRDSA